MNYDLELEFWSQMQDAALDLGDHRSFVLATREFRQALMTEYTPTEEFPPLD